MNLKCLFRTKLEVGATAPDFSLPSQTGEPIRLSQFRGKNVVLYFYPKDNTYFCIAESCSFRDSYEVFKEAGAEVIGVSSDTPESHARFAAAYKLPFLLLSDSRNAVRRLYGVRPTAGVIPGRVTFIIDSQGVIRNMFASQFSPKSHVDEALSFLRPNAALSSPA